MWLRACLFTCWVAFSPAWLHAQFHIVITGSARDSLGNPIPQATILLKDTTGMRMLAFAITRADGSFALRKTLLSASLYRLEAGHVQYQVQARRLFLSPPDSVYPAMDFRLSRRVTSMDEVVIRAKPPAFTVRGDTAEFRASAYRTAESKKVEDLLQQIPGFDIAGDGRISFNGKEVDRILVEGDDLTEQNYRLLSRNLHAGLVDKVQVISRYDENRLLAPVSNPDKVGINLTIDKKYMQRWSGTLEAGLGTGGQRMADLNLVRLAPSFKFIQFFQHNTIGLTANADMNHYFREGEPAGSSVSETNARGLVKAGSIHPPPLSTAYTHDNRDMSGFSILSWKAGAHLRMKILAGGLDTRLGFLSRGHQDVFLPDGTGWQTAYGDEALSEHKEGVLRFRLQHDAGRNNLGNYIAELATSRAEFRYTNFTVGAIRDSLRENLLSRLFVFHIRGQESFRLSRDIVLNLVISTRRDKPKQVFDAATGRFNAYFMIDSSFRNFRQDLPAVTNRTELDINASGKRKKLRWSVGLRSLLEGNVYEDQVHAGRVADGEDSLLRVSTGCFRLWRHTAYGSLQFPQGKKGRWGIGAVLGHGMAKTFYDSAQVRKEAGVYRFYAGYSFALNSMKQLSIQYQSSRELPPNDPFHPSGILSGQATILDGARELVFPMEHTVQVSYVSNNLHVGSSWLAMVAGGLGNRQYNTGLEAYPAYSIVLPLVADGNQNLTAQLKGERYLKALRSKFSLQLSVFYFESRFSYNSEPSWNRTGNLRIHPRWVSAFRSKFNAEFAITAQYTRNTTVPDKGQASIFYQWQYQGYTKVKLALSKKLFAALQYYGYRLSAGNYFGSMDLYSKWNISSAWSVALYGHNLFQSRVIEQRQFAVNTQSVQSFVLVNRYVMARVQWQF